MREQLLREAREAREDQRDARTRGDAEAEARAYEAEMGALRDLRELDGGVGGCQR